MDIADTAESTGAYNADRPIENPGDDLLGRASFASRLASILSSRSSADPLVVGLYGSWGSGKTSVINLAQKELEKKLRKEEPKRKKKLRNKEGPAEDPDVIAIVRFEPWNYVTSEQLLVQFFRELEQQLEVKKPGKVAAGLLEAVSSYATSVCSSGIAASLFPNAQMAAQLVALGVAAASGKPLEEVAKSFQDSADSLSSRKRKLEERLMELDGKIVVIIDDVDRLPNDQIRMIFQLVASLAKLPNINYLLSFDEEIVSRALGKVQDCDGREYLEKVVQVPVRLPDASRKDVDSILHGEIGSVFGLYGFRDDDIDEGKWRGICETFLEGRFRTLRDVRRFSNTLKAKRATLPENLSFEDVVAVTYIELTCPQFASWIQDNKERLCGSSAYLSMLPNGDQKESLAKLKESIAATAPGIDADWAVEALCRLFPGIPNETGLTWYSATTELNPNGICNSDRFDSYFCSNTKGGISLREVDEFLLSADAGRAKGLFIAHMLNGDAVPFVGELARRADKVPDGRVELIARCAFSLLGSNGEALSCGSVLPFSTTADRELIRLGERLLERLGFQKSYAVLRGCMGESDRVSLALARLAGQQLHALRDGGETTNVKVLLEEKDAVLLADAVCGILVRDGESRNLFGLPEYGDAMRLWEYHRPQQYAEYAVARAKADVEGCARFLLHSAAKWKDGSGRISSFQFDKDALEKVVGLSAIESVIQAACADGSFFDLDEDSRLACAAFCVACRDGAWVDVERDEAEELLRSWRADLQ